MRRPPEGRRCRRGTVRSRRRAAIRPGRWPRRRQSDRSQISIHCRCTLTSESVGVSDEDQAGRRAPRRSPVVHVDPHDHHALEPWKSGRLHRPPGGRFAARVKIVSASSSGWPRRHFLTSRGRPMSVSDPSPKFGAHQQGVLVQPAHVVLACRQENPSATNWRVAMSNSRTTIASEPPRDRQITARV